MNVFDIIMRGVGTAFVAYNMFNYYSLLGKDRRDRGERHELIHSLADGFICTVMGVILILSCWRA